MTGLTRVIAYRGVRPPNTPSSGGCSWLWAFSLGLSSSRKCLLCPCSQARRRGPGLSSACSRARLRSPSSSSSRGDSHGCPHLSPPCFPSAPGLCQKRWQRHEQRLPSRLSHFPPPPPPPPCARAQVAFSSQPWTPIFWGKFLTSDAYSLTRCSAWMMTHGLCLWWSWFSSERGMCVRKAILNRLLRVFTAVSLFAAWFFFFHLSECQSWKRAGAHPQHFFSPSLFTVIRPAVFNLGS